MHQCVVIDDAFMNKVEERDPKSLKLWGEILKTRLETGEPYIMFEDNVNNNNPEAYKKNNLNVSMTNICSEISLYTDELHSFSPIIEMQNIATLQHGEAVVLDCLLSSCIANKSDRITELTANLEVHPVIVLFFTE